MNDDLMTLAEARDRLREEAKNGGGVCPCCRQRSQVYRRKLTSAMARSLITMYRASEPGEFIYVPDVLRHLGARGDELKLLYWNLIEKQPGIRDDGSPRTGWWRLTDVGRLFVESHKRVPSHARVYDGKFKGYDGEAIDIIDALGAKFSYDELMGRVSS